MKCPEQKNPWRHKGDWWLAGAEQKEKLRGTANVYEVSFWGEENILELDSADGCMSL